MSNPVQSSPVHDYAFLITGANFANKGAQSMLYVTASELAARFPSCKIYFHTTEDYPEKDYTFKKTFFDLKIAKTITSNASYVKEAVKDTVKFIIGRKRLVLSRQYVELKQIIRSLTAIVDVSGFAIGSTWGNFIPSWYIEKVMMAKTLNIPIYMMPQSFGPFDYTPDVMSELEQLIKRELAYPRVIFAREKQGYDDLMNIFGLKNVRSSSDLVLQNRSIDLKNIFVVPPVLSVPKIQGNKELAGIVPNMRCFDHGDKEKILAAYRAVIDFILQSGYSVVLFRHSREDIEACKILKGFYPNDERVIMLENEFSCLEYNEFVKQFKFLVCSRYHGLVHAYKNIIPCVALGWAVKYQGLAEVLGQSSYVFDITGDIEPEKITGAISRLLANYDGECGTIRERLAEIQRHNCFDIIEEDIRRYEA